MASSAELNNEPVTKTDDFAESTAVNTVGNGTSMTSDCQPDQMETEQAPASPVQELPSSLITPESSMMEGNPVESSPTAQPELTASGTESQSSAKPDEPEVKSDECEVTVKMNEPAELGENLETSQQPESSVQESQVKETAESEIESESPVQSSETLVPEQESVIPVKEQGVMGKDSEPVLQEQEQAMKEPETDVQLKETESCSAQPEASLLEEKESEPTVNEPEPSVKEPEAVVKEPKPVVKEPEPSVKEAEPVMEEPEPIAKEPDSSQKEPQPILNEPEHSVKEPEAESDSSAMEVEPAVKVTEPTVKESEPSCEEAQQSEMVKKQQVPESVVKPNEPELESTSSSVEVSSKSSESKVETTPSDSREGSSIKPGFDEDDIPIVGANVLPHLTKQQDTSPVKFIDTFAKWLADMEKNTGQPAKKVDRRQQRHTASTVTYVPGEKEKSGPSAGVQKKPTPYTKKPDGKKAWEEKPDFVWSTEIPKEEGKCDTSEPQSEQEVSVSGDVQTIRKSSKEGEDLEEEMDYEEQSEDGKPSESLASDVPVIAGRPMDFQEESLQGKDTESFVTNDDQLMDGSSMVSESISETSESLSSLNKMIDRDEETRDSVLGDKKDGVQDEGQKEGDGETKDEDKENEEERDTVGSLDSVPKTPKPKKTRRGSIGFGVVPDGHDALIMVKPGSKFPPEKLFEYQWPQDKGDFYMLQEQLSEYLGVKSFKRKYPDLPRKNVEMQERNFLKEQGIVTEMQCDLGLTAVRSEDVLDLMQKDYEDKYKEYTAILHEREKQKMKEKTKNYGQPNVEKSKMADFIKKAVKSTAEFNSHFMRELRNERKAYFDLQTQDVQFPLGRCKKLPKEATKVGAYPVAVIPGQFQDYYKRYTPHELKYFPLNTAIYAPPKKLQTIFADPNVPTDSESEESEGSRDSSGSGSGSDSGSSRPASPKETPMETNGDNAEQNDATAEPEKPAEPEPTTCKVCTEVLADGVEEEMVFCAECKGGNHPSCLELTEDMIQIIKTYPWQCMECKTCVECMDPYDEDKMMFCDHCDRGYHTFCVGVKSIPTGQWECASCRKTEPATPKAKKRRREKAEEKKEPEPKKARRGRKEKVKEKEEEEKKEKKRAGRKGKGKEKEKEKEKEKGKDKEKEKEKEKGKDKEKEKEKDKEKEKEKKEKQEPEPEEKEKKGRRKRKPKEFND